MTPKGFTREEFSCLTNLNPYPASTLHSFSSAISVMKNVHKGQKVLDSERETIRTQQKFFSHFISARKREKERLFHSLDEDGAKIKAKSLSNL